jgi:hypothetical protein
VDNSREKDKYFDRLIGTGIRYTWMPPNKNDDSSRRFVMTDCMNFIRAYALAYDYDYFFSLECDVFPPLDIIEQLLKIDAPVAGAIYFTNHGADSQIMIMRIEPPQAGPETISRCLTTDESFLFCDGTIKHVLSCGFGCTLIKTEVLQNIKFRIDPKSPVHHDNIFFSDLYKLKIPVKAHTGIICRHINSHWGKVFETERRLKDGT